MHTHTHTYRFVLLSTLHALNLVDETVTKFDALRLSCSVHVCLSIFTCSEGRIHIKLSITINLKYVVCIKSTMSQYNFEHYN